VPIEGKDDDDKAASLDRYLDKLAGGPRDPDVPTLIVCGNRDIMRGTPDWPGDAIAKEVDALYRKLLCGPGKPKPNRFNRLARELLGYGPDDQPLPRRIRRKRHED
jgi:hypothetical protein